MAHKRCEVCASAATPTIDHGLRAGLSPRSLGKLFKELSRTDIKRHQERCRAAEEETTEEEDNAA